MGRKQEMHHCVIHWYRKECTVCIMLQWLIDLFQPIWTAIMALLVWMGLISPHQEVTENVVSNVVPENELHVEKPSEDIAVPSNE